MPRAVHDIPIRNKDAAGNLLQPAEEHLAARQGGTEAEHPRVIRIQDGIIFRPLVAKDLPFCLGIGLEGRVAVQVVWRNVQQDGHVGTKIANGFQLKATQLGNNDRARIDPIHGGAQSDTNIPTDKSGEAGGLKHFAQKHRRGRLAVRTGNTHNGIAQVPARHFNLRDNGNASRTSCLELRQVPRHPGADYHEIVSEKGLDPLRPQLQANLLCQKLRQEGSEGGRRLDVGHRHDRATPLQAECYGLPAPP